MKNICSNVVGKKFTCFASVSCDINFDRIISKDDIIFFLEQVYHEVDNLKVTALFRYMLQTNLMWKLFPIKIFSIKIFPRIKEKLYADIFSTHKKVKFK